MSTYSVSNALAFAQTSTTPFSIYDTDANIAANADALVKLGTQLTFVQIRNSYKTLDSTISAADAIALAPKLMDHYGNGANYVSGVLSKGHGTAITFNHCFIQNTQFGVTFHTDALTGNVSWATIDAAGALPFVQAGFTTPLAVFDTDANIAANADALVKAGGQLNTVQIRNSYKTLDSTISAADAIALAPKLMDDFGNYGVVFQSIIDTAQNISAHIDQLESMASQIAKGWSIGISDSQNHLSLTAAQYANDLSVLQNMGPIYTMTIANVSAANAATVLASKVLSNYNGSVVGTVSAISLLDSTANVLTKLDSLQANAAKLSGITLTDKTTPTLAIKASQLINDSAVLAKIGTAYKLGVSGESVANVVTDLKNSHVTAIGVTDSAAHVLTKLDSLQANAAKLSGITLTDSGIPTLAVSAQQFANDAAVLAKIGTAYKLALTDKGTPTITLTASQFSQDTALLGKISTPYNLGISGELATKVAVDVKNSHVTTIGLVDSAANISANLSVLASNLGKLSGITLTDKATPTLSLTAAQVTGDLGVLNAIKSPYLLSVKDTVANLNSLALGGVHNSQIEIMPTSLLATLTENTQITNLNLSQINLTGFSITEKVYHGTGTEVDIVNSKGVITNQLLFTHDTESQLHLLGTGSAVVHVM